MKEIFKSTHRNEKPNTKQKEAKERSNKQTVELIRDTLDCSCSSLLSSPSLEDFFACAKYLNVNLIYLRIQGNCNVFALLKLI
jgi:hypothetical protein